MKEKGVAIEQKPWERKNVSKEQGTAEVGLPAGLLSKLRAANKGGIVGIVSCPTMDLMIICWHLEDKEGKGRNKVRDLQE